MINSQVQGFFQPPAPIMPTPFNVAQFGQIGGAPPAAAAAQPGTGNKPSPGADGIMNLIKSLMGGGASVGGDATAAGASDLPFMG